MVVIEKLIRGEWFPVGELVGFGLITLMLLGGAVWANHRQRRRFVMRWRSESRRHRDRLRMKQELEYAREIQLSMLPRSAPQVPWLDVAALSLPANEVGGDYYDYFQLDEQHLCVVVGDVTGHGVASGLILSGVRAGLNLLQDEMVAPEAILERVNRMLVRTAAPRMLMTLGVTVFSAAQRRAIVATAAHPPALHLRAADGALVEVGRGSLPLGAREDTTYASDPVDLAAGDLLLLYSDGLVEAVNAIGEQFGWERLEKLLVEIGREGSAAQVRDRVLREVWEFKGETAQVDDVTMVAVRIVG
jgi:sigma-B regulation protein RsbU (phosphoserine phosphatase)